MVKTIPVIVVKWCTSEISVRCYQYFLLLKELRELSILMHRHQDIATADKLLVQIELWDSRPVRVLFDT